jgi:hypothetical protein
MSPVGHSRPNWAIRVMSGYPSVATVRADIPVRQPRATFGHTNGQVEADIMAVTRLTICGSRRELDRFTR